MPVVFTIITLLLALAGITFSSSPEASPRHDAGDLSSHSQRARSRLPLPHGDADRDGLDDDDELTLATAFAPIVALDPSDTTRPASIPRRVPARVPEDARGGSDDPNDWTTYVHVFPRDDGGIDLQYWFFYPYNDGPLFFDHDSDWEHVTVRLDAQRRPVGAYLARHENDRPGDFFAWTSLQRASDHPVVLSASGSHATYASLSDVAWFDRATACDDLSRCDAKLWRTWRGGGLVNLGERASPMRETAALDYAGRWGRVRFFPGTSAPFGPLHHRGFCAGAYAGCEDERSSGEEAPVTAALPARSGGFDTGINGTLTSTAIPVTSHIAP